MDKLVEFLKKLIMALFPLPKEDDDRETPKPDQVKRATIGFIVGHSKNSGGAALATGGNEYSYNSEVARLAGVCANANHPLLYYHTILRDSGGISGAYAKARELGCDLIIELHFNAFNGRVTGTETLCSNDKSDQDFATRIQTAMCKVFERDGNSRGVKIIARAERGGINVYSAPGTPNCLVEPFFGDVKSEADMGLDKQYDYAQALVKACEEHLKATGVL